MWGKKLLEKVNSPINAEITIYSIFGSPRMTIGGLLQSGGIVSEIWKKSIKAISNPSTSLRAGQPSAISNILILGLGCGTAAKVFAKAWPEAKITGIEIDKEVIRLGKKYFGLGEIPNLKIVNQDAVKYIKNFPLSTFHFQLIIIDLYLGEKIPPKSESLSFLRNLRNLLASDGVVIFNRIFWDKHRKEAEKFVEKAEKIFPKVELVRTVANLLVSCSD